MAFFDRVLKNTDYLCDNSSYTFRIFEMLEKCFLSFAVPLFKVAVIFVICILFSNVETLNGLLYLFISYVIFDNTITITNLVLTSMATFVLAVVMVCVFFIKNGNNNSKAVSVVDGCYRLVNEKFNS